MKLPFLIFSNKNIVRLLFLLSSIFFNSCKKESSTESSNSIKDSECYLSYTISNNERTDIYYNSEKKIVKVKGTQTLITIDYSKDSVVEKTFDNHNFLMRTEIYILGSNGYAVRSFREINYETTEDIIYKSEYEYDSSGFLSKQINYRKQGGSEVQNFIIKDGNLISTTASGVTYMYEYSPLLRKFDSNAGFSNMSYLLGKPSKNLVSKITTSYTTNGNVTTDDFSRTYELTAKGYIKSITFQQIGPNMFSPPTTTNYFYTCD